MCTLTTAFFDPYADFKTHASQISLKDKRTATALLAKRGATIDELNCVRKHISAVKGGRLAAAAHPATVLALILSDVIGDPLETIASGPTVPDSTTCVLYSACRNSINRLFVTVKCHVHVA